MPDQPNSSDNPNPPAPFNPMAFWTDIGLRALDTALSSTQNIGDGVDRLTRAGASAEVSDASHASRSARGDRGGASPDFGFGTALDMQRTALNLMTQAWEQWLSSFRTLAALGAGSSFKDAERNNPWLKSISDSLTSATQTMMRASSPASLPRHGGGRRDRPAEGSVMEHAAATPESRRPRRGGRAKAATGSRGGSRRER